MKNLYKSKKIFALFLAAVMMMAMSVTAFAQEVSGDSGNAQITISNAAKGETYAIYKLFDASIGDTDNGSIAYTGEIPDVLNQYFSTDSSGNVVAIGEAITDGEMSDDLRNALKNWTASVSALETIKSDGSVLKFNNLGYGYYVVTTTQGEQLISVTSPNPTATIVDKNSTTPTSLEKTVDDNNVKFGDTVTYTVKFKTANYDGDGTSAKKIVSYTIEDTLLEFLDEVNVTSIILDKDGNTQTTNDQTKLSITQFVGKKIIIPWVNEQNNSLYSNGSYIILTYTAVVTEQATVDGNGNTNTVSMTWKVEGEDTGRGTLKASATIYTYAIAIKKVDSAGENLEGAEFKFPFYVKKDADADGAYIYAGDTEGEGLVNTLTTSKDGNIVVKGLESGIAVSITETKAPDGYNLLTAPVVVTPEKTSKTTTNKTIKLDENGTVSENGTIKVNYQNDNIATTVIAVMNKSGSSLPSTGGIGTTIFYIIGGILVVGAGVILITRHRMDGEE